MKSADSVNNSVGYDISKTTDHYGIFTHVTTKPKGKQFDVGKKAKVMAWFYEEISAKEIASRLQKDVSGIRKVINQNKALPLTTTSLPPKKRSGWPSVSTNREVDRVGCYLKQFLFKTAGQLKAEVNGWSNISIHTIQKVCQKKLKMPSHSAAKKLLLTARMVRKRLQFCKKYRSWTEKD